MDPRKFYYYIFKLRPPNHKRFKSSNKIIFKKILTKFLLQILNYSSSYFHNYFHSNFYFTPVSQKASPSIHSFKKEKSKILSQLTCTRARTTYRKPRHETPTKSRQVNYNKSSNLATSPDTYTTFKTIRASVARSSSCLLLIGIIPRRRRWIMFARGCDDWCRLEMVMHHNFYFRYSQTLCGNSGWHIYLLFHVCRFTHERIHDATSL